MPRIDYRGLNDITVKNHYPLPLMSLPFKLLQWVTIFMKLDLRNAYRLVRIREGSKWKTSFNTPTGLIIEWSSDFWGSSIFVVLFWLQSMCDEQGGQEP